jgi:putative ABC transport system permease protein
LDLRLIYLHRNLTRNVRRTVLTCAAVALPIMIYVLSMAVVDGLNQFLENSVKQLRLIVTQKTSIINPLPEGHRRKIEAMDPTKTRITAVCGVRWIGGKRENDPTPLSVMAADPEAFVAAVPEYNLTQQEIDAWIRDRQAVIVGRKAAGQMGWKVGDRINIVPTLPPYRAMEFHVVSTAPLATDPQSIFFRRDYLDEELKKDGFLEGLVSFYFVKCAGKGDLDYYRQEIDRFFAGTLDETRSLDEKTFMSEFIAQNFDIPRNLTILSALTVFVAILAAMNTMSMNFRDRIAEFATLKSLGFSGFFTFAIVQFESLLLCAIGGLIGAMIPFITFTYTPAKDWQVPIIQTLMIPMVTCYKSMGIAIFIGLLAAIWPSWLAFRMHVVQALRNLE